ncbi:MAG: hypothetical protein LBJ81_02595 [Puniceicoccales bacterium]|jgi:hypothetical protein|nr:hypothetical protein [Puniceicoccales bacterium]
MSGKIFIVLPFFVKKVCNFPFYIILKTIMKTVALKWKGGLLSALVISVSCLNTFASEAEEPKLFTAEELPIGLRVFLSREGGIRGPVKGQDGRYRWTAEDIEEARTKMQRATEMRAKRIEADQNWAKLELEKGTEFFEADDLPPRVRSILALKRGLRGEDGKSRWTAETIEEAERVAQCAAERKAKRKEEVRQAQLAEKEALEAREAQLAEMEAQLVEMEDLEARKAQWKEIEALKERKALVEERLAREAQWKEEALARKALAEERLAREALEAREAQWEEEALAMEDPWEEMEALVKKALAGKAEWEEWRDQWEEEALARKAQWKEWRERKKAFKRERSSQGRLHGETSLDGTTSLHLEPMAPSLTKEERLRLLLEPPKLSFAGQSITPSSGFSAVTATSPGIVATIAATLTKITQNIR